MMETQFKIDRITVIEIFDRRKSSWKWLPEKQKKCFFGMFSRNKWHSEGFYSNGCYEECYESGCWDATPSSREYLIESGLLIDKDDTVWHKPYVKVHLGPTEGVTKGFKTYEEALEWAEELRVRNGGDFEIIRK